MADRVITAEALITAKDMTGDAMLQVAKKFEAIGKAAHASPQIDALAKSLQRAQEQMKVLDRLQANRGAFSDARARFNQTTAAVVQASRAMQAAQGPTKQLQASYAAAQRAVSQASAAFERQKGAVIAAKGALEGFGVPVGKIAAEQARLRGVIDSTTKALERQAVAERKAAASAQHVLARPHGHGRTFGGGLAHAVGSATGISSMVGGYGLVHAAGHVAHTYREFDKERRYGRAIMGITDEEQEPLVRQAIHGSAHTKYNDIQWLEAQRELAARGLNVDQVRAIAEVAATHGQAMGKSLPDASKALEGGMFGFGKDTSTYESAVANARRTADLQVKASKQSGMNYDDIVALYKFSAAPFHLAGLSEEQMLTFGGLGKKANIGGDEMGTAGRALVANLLKPTAGARTAMLANGIDYSSYQKAGAKPMNVDNFAKSIAMSYGVELDAGAKAAIQKVFNDKAIVGNAAKFMPAMGNVLNDVLGGDDAKSKKSIMGEARRYRDASMGGVDAKALLSALIPGMASNPAFANAMFGSKQGARIMTAYGDPALVGHKLHELESESQGYAKGVSDARMAGFDGAVSRVEGAVKALEASIGRTLDNKGKGGALTGGMNLLAGGVQHLAELSPATQMSLLGIGGVGTGLMAAKGLQTLAGGFGLSTSAGLLDKAAFHLMGVPVGGKGMPGVIPGGGPGGAASGGKPGFFSPLWQTMLYQAGTSAIDYGLSFLPRSQYPAGYDPQVEADKSMWQRMKELAGHGDAPAPSGPLPTFARAGMPGPNGPIDITGKVQADVHTDINTRIKIDVAPGLVITQQNQTVVSQPSTGQSMPGAAAGTPSAATRDYGD